MFRKAYITGLGQKGIERGEYAGKEEFARVFESERDGLQRLALLLTVDSESARRCLARAFRECNASSSVSMGWALSWTRRTVIRNAISLLMDPEDQPSVNTNDDGDDGQMAFLHYASLGALAVPKSICDLPEFDRFVFIMCVLERYSVHDCALLLGRSPRDVNEARLRIGNRVGQIDELNDISRYVAMR